MTKLFVMIDCDNKASSRMSIWFKIQLNCYGMCTYSIVYPLNCFLIPWNVSQISNKSIFLRDWMLACLLLAGFIRTYLKTFWQRNVLFVALFAPIFCKCANPIYANMPWERVDHIQITIDILALSSFVLICTKTKYND